ncbi:MAG: acyl-CoA reductase [Bacteroidetes bacterium]|nr:acyl-CoA reductase [Bacteroidota bacterium]
MTLKQRSEAFVQLGLFINRHLEGKQREKEARFHQDLDKIIETAFLYNGWFTHENVILALRGIARMLEAGDVEAFSKQVKEPQNPRNVAVIMAGNIPAVGFHDMLCVLLSGHSILIKVSSDDHAIIPFLAGMLIYFEPGFAPRIAFSGAKLENFDAVIATGSNNSSRYFEYYFGKYPHIIRRNRTSVAVLHGNESDAELKALGSDVFRYFGLGCRNVTKLYVPEGYTFNRFFEAIYDFKEVVNNKKYGNNYDYNRAIYLLDGVKFLDNNFLMIREHAGLNPPASTIHYEYYSNQDELVNKITELGDELQCVACNFSLGTIPRIALGCTQEPGIFDFADNVNTIDFLNGL